MLQGDKRLHSFGVQKNRIAQIGGLIAQKVFVVDSQALNFVSDYISLNSDHQCSIGDHERYYPFICEPMSADVVFRTQRCRFDDNQILP